MKQLIRREVREHYKLAVIGFLILSAMLTLGFFDSRAQLQRAAVGGGYRDPESFHPLVSKQLLTQASFFCALFGALLGWLQIRAEKHPDLWAFLLHRPVQRSSILRSKIASGLLLYTMGAALPVTGLILVAIQPGAVAAPTEWRMALPLLAVVLAGTACYFAGALTALRQARWYASRGVGLGLAGLAMSAVTNVPEFWHALGIVAIADSLLVLGVWGHFQTGGFYKGQARASKCALILTSTAFATVALGIALAIVFQALQPEADYVWTQYNVSKDGKILRVTTHQATGEMEAVDLAGNPVLDPATGKMIKPTEWHKLVAPSIGLNFQENAEAEDAAGLRPHFSNALRYFRPWRALRKSLWYLTREGA
ncbi:MAG: hypothetical protein HYR88_07255, partial [Verrucomicrobia bacterium]|nr:hypothetical protein [Verrucomicrobiota bacterium]